MLTTKPVDFYSNCVSRSRPCLLSSMAKQWPAYSKWSYAKGGVNYLKGLIGDASVNVFVDNNPPTETNDDNTYTGFSFANP